MWEPWLRDQCFIEGKGGEGNRTTRPVPPTRAAVCVMVDCLPRGCVYDMIESLNNYAVMSARVAVSKLQDEVDQSWFYTRDIATMRLGPKYSSDVI
jgi:hypothetical protein